MNWKLTKLVALAFLMLSNAALASSHEIAEIIIPVTKVVDLVTAVVNIVAGLAITVAGAMYLFAGNNIQTRENAKSMLTYAVIGLIIINAAPTMAKFLAPPTA